MKNVLAVTLFAASLPVSAYAMEQSCYVQVAVSSNAGSGQNVAFNVTNTEMGLNRSLTVSGNGSPQIIPDLPCVASEYTISATGYTPQHIAQSVGICALKSGAVFLSNAGDNVSVVFPEDFVCD
ncbi:hypothetical protein [Legionella sp. CNM-4043-24]|uniref:hypothetical protein n=1 Tax=Legionella sp. CNM-4043-24 TaxID=3421646 RepID=UPI00403AA255